MTSEDQNEPTMEEILASIRRIIRDDTDDDETRSAPASSHADATVGGPQSEDVLELTDVVPELEDLGEEAGKETDEGLAENVAHFSARDHEKTEHVSERGLSTGEVAPQEETAQPEVDLTQDGPAFEEADAEEPDDVGEVGEKNAGSAYAGERSTAGEPSQAPSQTSSEAFRPATSPDNTIDVTERTQGNQMSDEQHGSAGKDLPEETTLVSSASADTAASAFERLRQEEDQGGIALGSGTLEGLVKELLRPILKNWLDENLPAVVERLVQEEIDRVTRRRR